MARHVNQPRKDEREQHRGPRQSRYVARRLGTAAAVIVGLSVTASTVFSSAAVASRASLSLRERVVVTTHGATRSFSVSAETTPSASCGLLVRTPGSAQSLPFLSSDNRGRAGWSWSAGASAPRGRWSFTVRCSLKGVSKTRFAARRLARGSARGPIGDPSSFHVLSGALIEATARTGDPKGLGGEVNPFPWHQCTWWAWVKRADVYDAAVHAGVPAGGSRGVHQGQTVYVWDGARWFYNAQRAGLPTGRTPVAGALVGWDEYPGNPFGHIAYVESVASATSIVISECNGFTLVCGSRRVNPLQMRGPLEGYIYGGPAGNPGSVPPATPSPSPAPSLHLAITGVCTTNGGVLTGTSSGFTPGGTATLRAWYPNGSEYTNIIHTSRVHSDGSIGWTWPCQGDPAGTYNTEAVDDASGASTGHVQFTIGVNEPPPTLPPTLPPTVPPPVTPTTYSEQETPKHPVNTFTDYHNASGMGPAIGSGQWVQVSCKVYDPTIASVNPDGYWYRIASSPWNNAYYSPANTFMNGDPYGGPYTHNTDYAVPNC